MLKFRNEIDAPILNRYGGFLGGFILLATAFAPKFELLAKYPKVSFVIFSLSVAMLLLITLRMLYIQFKYKREISLLGILLCLVWIGNFFYFGNIRF